MSTSRILLAGLALSAIVGFVRVSAEEKPKTEAVQFSAKDLSHYERDVLPILKANCHKCHANGKTKGGLSMATRAGLIEGGETGSALNKDEPNLSLLLKAVRYEGGRGVDMPPSGKLPPKDVEILVQWVRAGMPMPANEDAIPTEKPKHKGGVVDAEAKNYWAYKALVRPEVPKVERTEWVKNPIDAFVLKKLEDKKIAPNPVADKTALVRRAYYDLIGLPPTPEQVDAFVKDTAPDAWSKLIDALLASPHYGEKWGRNWLDVVRYGETNGYERDNAKPNVWRYRDYVVKAFNDDKPYDRFVREQLAGDEMPGVDPDRIVATGYYRLGLWDDEPADRKLARFDEFDDWVATTGQVFLGMTLNCARCHDHKIDPILQADYYKLVAFFADVPRYDNSTDPRVMSSFTDISPPTKRAAYEADLKTREARKSDVRKRMVELEEKAIRKMPAPDQRASEGPDRPKVLQKLKEFMEPADWKTYGEQRKEIEVLNRTVDPRRDMALSVNGCTIHPPETNIMIRGNPNTPGAKVEPGFPKVLTDIVPSIPRAKTGDRTAGRRLVLADWIVAKENPVTARVMANRIWQGHFGRGIVASSNDFGLFGTPPTHPDLLNWLASEFMKQNWSIKSMHRLMMNSNTYTMSSKGSDAGLKADPSNDLFWRFNMRRLVAEEVRDTFLSVSGQLNLKAGGPSVYPPMPKEVLAGQSVPGSGWPTSNPEEAARRSIYVHIKRSLQLPILAQHDQADSDSSCPVRYTTTVPTQALGMINGDFSQQTAVALAARLKRDAKDLPAQVALAIRLTTGREASKAEIERDLKFIADAGTKRKLDPEQSLKLYCLMAINASEMVYLD